MKCAPSSEDANICQNCIDFEVDCTYNRPRKKRGVQPGIGSKSSGTEIPTTSPILGGHLQSPTILSQNILEQSNLMGDFTFLVTDAHRSMVLAQEKLINDLVSVYLEVVYPMYVRL
jgi:hypothetical protein